MLMRPIVSEHHTPQKLLLAASAGERWAVSKEDARDRYYIGVAKMQRLGVLLRQALQTLARLGAFPRIIEETG